jgi:hypothetical protein
MLGFVWLGLPLGAIWMDLIPSSRRLALACVLVAGLSPLSLTLAWAIQQAQPTSIRRSSMRRSLVWLGTGAAAWLGNELFNGGQPFFGVSVSLLAVAFVLALPLWLVPDRKGIWIARGISHAGSAGWLLACHLLFVHGG